MTLHVPGGLLWVSAPPPERLDLTDLIPRLLVAGQRVVSFPVSEYWCDIGQHTDYQRALEEMERGDADEGEWDYPEVELASLRESSASPATG